MRLFLAFSLSFSFFPWETQSHFCNLGCLELSMYPSASPLQCCVCSHTQKDPISEKRKTQSQKNKQTKLFLHLSYHLRRGANSFCACQLPQPLSPVCQWGSGPGWGGVASVMAQEGPQQPLYSRVAIRKERLSLALGMEWDG